MRSCARVHDLLGHLNSFSINAAELEYAFGRHGFDVSSISGFTRSESDMIACGSIEHQLIPWREDEPPTGGCSSTSMPGCDPYERRTRAGSCSAPSSVPGHGPLTTTTSPRLENF